MNQYCFHIISGRRDLGLWWVMGWDESDARNRMALSFAGTNIDDYGYTATLNTCVVFGEIPATKQENAQ